MDTKHFDFGFEVKAVNADGTVEGYGSVFAVKDSYSDVIQKGAFEKSITEHKGAGSMPAMLWQHDSGQPIGVWTDMVEDAKGLRLKGKLAMDTVKGKEAHALLKMGAINGLSIGFMSKNWSYDEKAEIRTLTEVELWEVSLVTFPANTKARVTHVKAAEIGSITTIRQAEAELREAGLSRDEAKALVAAVKRIALEERDVLEAVAAEKAAKRLLSTLTDTKE